eukprot:4996828-Prymnesium_polylepis.1
MAEVMKLLQKGGAARRGRQAAPRRVHATAADRIEIGHAAAAAAAVAGCLGFQKAAGALLQRAERIRGFAGRRRGNSCTQRTGSQASAGSKACSCGHALATLS